MGPSIDDEGRVSFVGTVANTTLPLEDKDGVWSGVPGDLDLIAIEGSAEIFNSPILYNNEDQIVYQTGDGAFLHTFGNPGTTSTIISVGMTVPLIGSGTADLKTFGGNPDEPTLNDVEQIAFNGSIESNGSASVLPENDEGVWVIKGPTSTASSVMIARKKDIAPGTSHPFADFGGPGLNQAGTVVFRGRVDTDNNNSEGDVVGIWTGSNNSNLTLVALGGTTAPGTSEDFDNLAGGNSLVINETGQVLFAATLVDSDSDSSNDAGIWLYTPGASPPLEIVARAGDDAPGALLNGITQQQFGENFTNPLLNAAGQAVFENNITTGTSNSGIWALTGNQLVKVIYAGDEVDVDPGSGADLRDSTGNIYFAHTNNSSGGQDGRGRSLNDSGEMTFAMGFASGTGGPSGSGIFTASLAIPGDLNGDMFVGIDDLNIVLANWNLNVPPGDPRADPSGDGFVGIDDLNEVLANWNCGIPPVPGSLSQVSSSIVSVNNSSALTGYETQDLKVNTVDDWTTASMVLELTNGSIYQDTAGGNTAPNPALFSFVPSVEFDTYVAGGPSAAIIAGSGGDAGGGSELQFDDERLDVSWSNNTSGDTGDIQIARVTLTDDADGTFTLVVTQADDATNHTYTGTITDGIMAFDP